MPILMRLLRLTPVEAVIEFAPASGSEVRGRLMGPICMQTTTIEVAYHVRCGRIIIPEPAWWDPESPFLYRGPIEVWHGGDRLKSETVQIGLRYTTRGGDHIIHNGRRVDLRPKRIDAGDEMTLRHVRQTGFNA